MQYTKMKTTKKKGDTIILKRMNITTVYKKYLQSFKMYKEFNVRYKVPHDEVDEENGLLCIYTHAKYMKSWVDYDYLFQPNVGGRILLLEVF